MIPGDTRFSIIEFILIIILMVGLGVTIIYGMVQKDKINKQNYKPDKQFPVAPKSHNYIIYDQPIKAEME